MKLSKVFDWLLNVTAWLFLWSMVLVVLFWMLGLSEPLYR